MRVYRHFVAIRAIIPIYVHNSQIIMFVKVSGFHDADNIAVPGYLRSNTNIPGNSDSLSDLAVDCIRLALVRWLSPHPHAVLRDSELRPVCPPPFDVNHALWRFSQIPRRRHAFQGRNITRQLNLFPGKDVRERREHANRLSHAWYDLVDVTTIDKYMNCTCIDNDSELILQTVTLPF